MAKSEAEVQTIRMRAPMRYLIWIPDQNRLIGKTQGTFRPKVENGWVYLYNKWYRLDSTKIGVQEIRRRRSLFMLPIDQPFLMWREGDPEPMSLSEIWDDIPMPENRSGGKIAMFVGEKAIQKVIGRRPDLLMYILILLVGAFMGYIVGTYTPAVNGGP